MSKPSLDEAELKRMKVAELRRLAGELGVESPNKKLKAQLINEILQRQKPPETKPEKAKPTIEKIVGTIINYKTGMHSQQTHHMLIRLPNIDSAESASRYIGRKAVWTSKTGKRIVGRTVSIHGKSGTLLGRFRRGLPGQALGSSVEII
ncbi:MAG: 50S ribosomal protein L35ae [Candidatus Bathyarchaeia archaeon]